MCWETEESLSWLPRGNKASHLSAHPSSWMHWIFLTQESIVATLEPSVGRMLAPPSPVSRQKSQQSLRAYSAHKMAPQVNLPRPPNLPGPCFVVGFVVVLFLTKEIISNLLPRRLKGLKVQPGEFLWGF